MSQSELGRFRRSVALAVTVLLVAVLGPGIPAQADDGSGRPGVQHADKTVKGHQVKTRPRTPDPATRKQAAPKAAWPKSGRAEVALPTGRPNAGAVRAGDLPVWVGAPAKAAKSEVAQSPPQRVKVSVLDRKSSQRAGVKGPLFTIARSDSGPSIGRVGVQLNYSSWVNAFGGSYGSRLRLVQLPGCALSTPQRPECAKATPLATRNDTAAKVLTADVDAAPAAAGATLLAATAGASSDKGDYTATPLSASATWQVGTQTGDFTWTYPMRVPPVPGDLTPKLSIDYSSGSVDGRTSNTNGQPSWIGEGFDLWSGYIERRYKSCGDDGAPKDEFGNEPGDECWGYDNATISLNGKAGELIPAGGDTWRMKDDDGTRIQKLTGADNGDNDGEYWKVTTPDGVQYFFGKDRLPDWTSGKPETGSTWTVPVFGDDSGEPCHAAAFADSWCQQAWRWNLDYVLDPHGNAVTYYYTPETNHYARDLKASDGTVYTRGGYLDHIEYGLRSDDLFAKAPALVNFGVSERCIPDTDFDCAPSKIGDNPDQWWDVPWDQNCDAGTDCKDSDLNTIKASPTFWSRKRLTSVTTQVLKPDASGYRDVDSWALTQAWGLADVDRDLLLGSITHTGLAGKTPVTLPPVTFNHVQLANRVDKLGDDVGPYIKYRLGTVFDESGGQIDVNYSTPECTTDALPTPETNTKRCFPTYWVPPDGSKDPKIDWFHKYVVAQIVQSDRTGHAPDMVTNYDYQGGAAWHFDDDDGLTKEKYKTWSQWRGYATVSVQSGGDNDMQTQTDHQYFRGMDGDRLDKDGGKKDVTVSDGEGGTYPDADARQGFELKTTNHLSPGGAVTSKAINTVWTHQTAERVRSWGTTTANLTGTASTRTLTALDGGNWRETLVKNTFDDTTGLNTQVDDQGDTSTAADDQCTQTDYASNTTAWLLNTPSRVETVAVNCGAQVSRPAQVISDVRTYYDGGAFDAAPSKGDITKVEKVADYNGGTPVYVTDAASTYDAYGRTATVTDATGHISTTTYTPATGLPTSSKVTGPPVKPGDSSTALSTTNDLDPAWNLPTSNTDAGSKRTDVEYDALGRLINVWLPNTSKTAGDVPNLAYTYLISSGAPVAVRTKTLRPDDSQITSYVLYDGLLRPRQSQELGPDGGRLITDTFYNSQGKTARSYASYYAAGAPDSALFGIDTPGDVESQTAYDYDGLGRVTTERFLIGGGAGQEKWRTTTTYSGDRVTADPPTGATPTTTISDARGNVTEVRQYKAGSPTGDFDATKYTYTPAGKPATVTDAAGNKWTHTYDLRGREIRTDDPDKGTTTTSYDDLDQATSTQDARGKKLFFTYDSIGRKTEERQDSASGTLLTSWLYDTIRKGQLTSVTRNIGGASYVATNNAYDNLNQPTRTTYTVPSVTGEEKLAGSYQYNTRYNLDNTVQSTSFPLVSQASGMPAEVVAYSYDELRRPTTTTGNSTYVTKSLYSLTGKPEQYELSTGAKKTWLTYSYEYGTQRLAESRTERQDIAGVDRDAKYTYDDAGNVTSATDSSRAGTDSQCFAYDYLQRLTDAWTPTGACGTAPAKNLLGGPAPYWTSYSYDPTGNRTSETQHGTNAVAADTTRTYTYPAPGHGQHQLQSVTQTGAAGSRTDSFGYDATGNITTRAVGGRNQTLTWDSEGNLATTAEAAGTTGYAYDADGSRLLRRDPTSTTLYLPNMELRLDKTTNTVSGTRYYSHAGALIATRTAAGVQFLSSDPHGTAELSVDAATQAEAQRRFTPFGQFRGSPSGIWPTDKGFVGGTIDPDGLTHLGAREYDSDTGRFISVDPLFDQDDPQSWNGYAYADDNPVTGSDADGTHLCGGNWVQAGCDGPLPGADNSSSKGEMPPSSVGGGGPPRLPLGIRTVYARNWQIVMLALQKVQNKQQYKDIADRIWSCYGDISTSHCGGLVAMESIKFANAVCKQSGISCGGPTTGGLEYAMRHSDGLLLGFREGNTGLDAGKLRSAQGEPVSEAGVRNPDKPAPSCSVNSFVPGTQVLLADGVTKPIEQVKVGDRVLATDPKTGKSRAEPVIASFGGTNYKNLVRITVDTDGDRGHHTGIVTATEHHKFWNQTKHAWTRADHLTIGTTLHIADGTPVRIIRVAAYPGHPAVRDLTIASLHTYYVEAGTAPVLVHNTDSCRTASKYEDVTNPGARMPNKRIDVGPTEFGRNLEGNGWSRVEKDWGTVYEKEGARYQLRDHAKTHEGWTAEFFKSGSKKADLKIRLGED
ncbi:RHS repeat-associated core domain-containing protein [Actinoallomurus bryophytorum]